MADRGGRGPGFTKASLLGKILLGEEDRPEVLLGYIDTTPSTRGSAARWEDLAEQIRNFEDQAPPGSQWEIYRTGPEGDRPVLLDGATVRRLLPRDRKQRRAALAAQLRGDGERVAQISPAHAARGGSAESHSPIVEDIYRLYQRASALRSPSRLIVYSDLQELSPQFRWGRIAAADKPSAYAAIVRRAADAFPRLPNPPEEIDIFYSPGGAEQGPLSGAGAIRLQNFFKDVVASWGSRPVITEPRETEPASPGSTFTKGKELP